MVTTLASTASCSVFIIGVCYQVGVAESILFPLFVSAERTFSLLWFFDSLPSVPTYGVTATNLFPTLLLVHLHAYNVTDNMPDFKRCE